MSKKWNFNQRHTWKPKYFQPEEFDSPDIDSGGEKMDYHFMKMLDLARYHYKRKMVITSGYRTPSHNKAVGGVRNSAHVKAMAADISCRDSISRYLLIKALMQAGFTRIGIASTFIHVDNDITNSRNVIWTY